MSQVIWVPDKDYEWILANIIEDKGLTLKVSINKSDNISLRFNDSTILKKNDTTPITAVMKRDQLCEFDQSHLLDLNDLCDMKNLHQGPLLHILRRRWLQDLIYTYAGDILISINPYKVISALYENPLSYYDPKEDSHTKQPPHVYAIANSALKKLSSTQSDNIFQNQSVIISGESGAGKSSLFFTFCNKNLTLTLNFIL